MATIETQLANSFDDFPNLGRHRFEVCRGRMAIASQGHKAIGQQPSNLLVAIKFLLGERWPALGTSLSGTRNHPRQSSECHTAVTICTRDLRTLHVAP
jgi:hypothetical protein